jgi:hypothetical protein
MKTAVLICLAVVMLIPLDNHADGGVKNAEIKGLRLGMSLQEAVAAVEAAGYKLHGKSDACLIKGEVPANPCYNKIEGIRLQKIQGPSELDGGFSTLLVNVKDGKTYRVVLVEKYLLDRMPADFDKETAVRHYEEKYLPIFETRYKDMQERGRGTRRFEFDDESAPPYNRMISTPHAKVTVSSGRGTFVANIQMTWENLVGIKR